MPVFARIHKAPPVELFEAGWKASRLSLEMAYTTAFTAAERRNEFLDVRDGERDLQLEAYAQDIITHQQGAIVLLVTDDLLQRLGRGLSGKYPGLKVGFGPKVRGRTSLTILFRAMTNTIRHASGWDDDSDLDDGDED